MKNQRKDFWKLVMLLVGVVSVVFLLGWCSEDPESTKDVTGTMGVRADEV